MKNNKVKTYYIYACVFTCAERCNNYERSRTRRRETVGQECYAISGGPNGEYEILLDTGELVYQGVYVRWYNMEDFKRSLKIGFKGLDVVIVGKGVIHK